MSECEGHGRTLIKFATAVGGENIEMSASGAVDFFLGLG